MSGMLFIVPTPIGNLSDLTPRAIEVLKEADLILAEDTRTSGKLLKHFEINTPMRSYHMHNEHEITASLVKEMKSGKTLALVSDAGTPGISDPGYLMVRAAINNGIEVQTLPGANAIIPALVNSGLPSHSFVFEGFLPAKKGRKSRLEFLANESRTMIFYESPYRLLKTFTDLENYFGADRKASYSREISKKFEQTVRGSIAELKEQVKKNSPKGEFVICVAGKS